MSQPKTKRQRLASFLGLAVVCLGTLELAARIDDRLSRGAPLFGFYDMDLLYAQSPAGTVGRAGARFAKWGIDQQGFRGPEVEPDRGQTRVVAYGASETFGIYEDEGKEYPRQLQAELDARRPAPGFEVLNMALPGMRVGSGVAYLTEVARTYHPRYVVMYPTPTHYIGVSQPYCARPRRPRPDGETPFQLRIANKGGDVLKSILPRRLMTSMRRAQIEWSVRHEQVLDRVAPESLEAFASDIACAVQAARAQGAEPILVTHASRFAPTPRADDQYWLVAWRNQYPRLREEGFRDLERRANARTIEAARRLGVRLVDADAALSGEPGSFADYEHFTNAGSAKMARLLADAILAPGPAPSPASPPAPAPATAAP